MLYLSFALILFGILLFIYSIFSDVTLERMDDDNFDDTDYSDSQKRKVSNNKLHDIGHYHKNSSFNHQNDRHNDIDDLHDKSQFKDKKVDHHGHDDDSFELPDIHDELYFNDEKFDFDESPNDNFILDEYSDDKFHDDEMNNGFVAGIVDDEQHINETPESPAVENTIDLKGIILFDDRSNVIDYHNGAGRIDSSLEQYGSIKRLGEGKLVQERDGINFHMDKKMFRFDFHRIKELFSGANFMAIQIKGSSATKLFVIKDWSETLENIKEKFRQYQESIAS